MSRIYLVVLIEHPNGQSKKEYYPADTYDGGEALRQAQHDHPEWRCTLIGKEIS